jgi:DNA/RNA endonuclease YhcR with UshA esterase domain
MWNCRIVVRAVVILATSLLMVAHSAWGENHSAAEAVAGCSSFTEAKKHIGQKCCIRGQVQRVERSAEGNTNLRFCEDGRGCPFSVVVFEEGLHHVGAVESLLGRTIEITGKVRDYAGRAEIVLKDPLQLAGELERLPPAPKEFDVEERGKFSPGTFHASKSHKASHKKAKLPSHSRCGDWV